MKPYTEVFDNLSKHHPKMDNLPENTSTQFWEGLYRAFRDRMIAENPTNKSGVEE